MYAGGSLPESERARLGTTPASSCLSALTEELGFPRRFDELWPFSLVVKASALMEGDVEGKLLGVDRSPRLREYSNPYEVGLASESVTVYGETTAMACAYGLSVSNETRTGLCRRLRKRDRAITTAATSTIRPPITGPTIMAILDFCAEFAEAAVVVWDGAAEAVLILALELKVELVVLLQWVYMLLFVAASSLTPVLIVYT